MTLIRQTMLITLSGIILAWVLGSGCSKEDVLAPKPDWSCMESGTRPALGDSPCSDGQRFVKGMCVEARCDAGELAPNCCPGQFCDPGGSCQTAASRITECGSDADCEGGQRCLDRPYIQHSASETTFSCGWPSVDSTGACPSGGVAFNERCVNAAPCEGGCSDGQVCNIDTNRCESTPTLSATETSCSQDCGSSAILVYADPDSMLFDQCCEVSCRCETLPPLNPGAWGRFADISASESGAVVSAYDTTYGDLIFATHGNLSGALESIEYIDGVPTSGTVVADPAGPRDGIADPGEDVGQHTAIATVNGVSYISYYDVANQSLKLAHGSSGAFETFTVDDSMGDVGRYTSIVVDGSGMIHISYYAHRRSVTAADGSTVEVTGPMYARSTTATPSSGDDFEIHPVEEVTSCNGMCLENEVCVSQNGLATCNLVSEACEACECGESCVDAGGAMEPACAQVLPAGFSAPCGGNCPEGDACVRDDSNTSVCLEASTACETSCETGFTCVVLADETSACLFATPYSGISGVLEGVGLFTSIAIQDDKPVITYYDSIRKHLRGAQGEFTTGSSADAGFTTGPVACVEGDDVGLHSSLGVSNDGASVGIAYQALGGETLWAMSGTSLFDPEATHAQVDDGFRTSSLHLVGMGADVSFDDTGAFYIAYGDQTANDLVLAFQTADGWSYTTLLSNGAFGSFPAIDISGRTAWVATYKRERDSSDDDISSLLVHVADLDALTAD
ncbi:MAG: hypothetical protein HOI23_11910 [Deltaproteobacteria bacterium]|nr:hypothetical protein [Deltaproteobacteria bacterium]MBT6434629.1 hypothetical protein [Deltaproteobacteria bacterium]